MTTIERQSTPLHSLSGRSLKKLNRGPNTIPGLRNDNERICAQQFAGKARGREATDLARRRKQAE